MNYGDLPYVLTFGEHEGHVCRVRHCGTELTAQQADGEWACPWHWSGPVQLEMELA